MWGLNSRTAPTGQRRYGSSVGEKGKKKEKKQVEQGVNSGQQYGTCRAQVCRQRQKQKERRHLYKRTKKWNNRLQNEEEERKSEKQKSGGNNWEQHNKRQRAKKRKIATEGEVAMK